MKEIDFIPDWYTAGRKRKASYQTQYAAILLIIAAMASWSFYTARSVSNAEAQVQQITPAQLQQSQAAQEYKRFERCIAQLNDKQQLLSNLDQHISVSTVLAEISFLVDSSIVFTSLSLDAMPMDKPADDSSTQAIRVARSASQGQLAQGPIRFRCLVRGLASDASDVARLICSLEESVYFDQVIPGFSRTRTVKDRDLTEFEISCFISNYRQDAK